MKDVSLKILETVWQPALATTAVNLHQDLQQSISTKIIEKPLGWNVNSNFASLDSSILKTYYGVTDVLPQSSHSELGDHALFIKLVALTFRRALLSRKDHGLLFVLASTSKIIGRARHRLLGLLL